MQHLQPTVNEHFFNPTLASARNAALDLHRTQGQNISAAACNTASQTVSQFLQIAPSDFAETGAFDAILNVDSKVFIDPHLLKETKAYELRDSYSKINARFANILKLLSLSKKQDDLFWTRAEKFMTFRELKGLCIGYSSKGTSGSGMGPKLRRSILETAKSIVDEGVKDPTIFELIGLFQENVGPDRISDMVAQIIVEDLLRYSSSIFAKFNIPGKEVIHGQVSCCLPRNPFNGSPILLIPKDVLQNLPIAYCWEDIDVICAHNDALRRRVNELIGDTWKAATKEKKRVLRDVIVKQPELLQDMINLYKQKPRIAYDFNRDPAGQIVWLQAAQQAVRTHPMSLTLPKQPSADDVQDVVISICEKFKDLIENNALGSLLFNNAGSPKPEEAAQKLFFGVADAYCAANNLDLSRECNAGRGPVDFKISNGYRGRVVVEMKLSSNRLTHGLEVQTKEYQKAEKSSHAVFLAINVGGGSEHKLDELKEHEKSLRAAGHKIPTVFIVDARPKVSASKFQPNV